MNSAAADVSPTGELQTLLASRVPLVVIESREEGRVIELGTHDELMALGGRYRTMFDLQAKRFSAAEDEEGKVYDVLA